LPSFTTPQTEAPRLLGSTLISSCHVIALVGKVFQKVILSGVWRLGSLSPLGLKTLQYVSWFLITTNSTCYAKKLAGIPGHVRKCD